MSTTDKSLSQIASKEDFYSDLLVAKTCKLMRVPTIFFNNEAKKMKYSVIESYKLLYFYHTQIPTTLNNSIGN